MSLVFRENAKNQQNHSSFEVAVIEGNQFSKKYHCGAPSDHLFDNRKNSFLSFKNQEILQF